MEARATWLGRWCWFWPALAVWLELLIIFSYHPATRWVEAVLRLESWLSRQEWGHEWAIYLGPILYMGGVTLLTCLVTAALGSDLLSTRRDGTSDPLREPHPAVFLARLLGRLGPCVPVLLIWSATHLGLQLWYQITIGDDGSGPLNFTYRIRGWDELVPVLIEHLKLQMWCCLEIITLAALLSTTARRPRRWLIAPASVFFFLVLSAANNWSIDHVPLVSQLNRWLTWQDDWFWRGLAYAWPFYLETLSMAVAVWWIAARRYRSRTRFFDHEASRNIAA